MSTNRAAGEVHGSHSPQYRSSPRRHYWLFRPEIYLRSPINEIFFPARGHSAAEHFQLSRHESSKLLTRIFVSHEFNKRTRWFGAFVLCAAVVCALNTLTRQMLPQKGLSRKRFGARKQTDSSEMWFEIILSEFMCSFAFVLLSAEIVSLSVNTFGFKLLNSRRTTSVFKLHSLSLSSPTKSIAAVSGWIMLSSPQTKGQGGREERFQSFRCRRQGTFESNSRTARCI